MTVNMNVNMEKSKSTSEIPSSSLASSSKSATAFASATTLDREAAFSSAGASPSLSRKHVRIACLECRKSHFKCDGTKPICNKCVQKNRSCTYTESHRGGARKRGVSASGAKGYGDSNAPPSRIGLIPDIEDVFPKRESALPALTPTFPFDQHYGKNQFFSPQTPLSDRYSQLPCQQLPCYLGPECDKDTCPNDGHLKHHRSSEADDEYKRIKLDSSMAGIHNSMSNNKTQGVATVSLEDEHLSMSISDFTNLQNISLFDTDAILAGYYEHFHNAHPFLPPRHEIELYFADASTRTEFLMIMKIVADGRSSTIYSGDLQLISDRLLQCVQEVRNNNYNDVISMQILLLISLVAHISSLHIFSRKLRLYCFEIVSKLDLNNLDKRPDAFQTSMNSPASSVGSALSPQANALVSSRLVTIDPALFRDNIRRTFWEFHFLDVIIGSADGQTLSSFDSMPINIDYPTYPDSQKFYYKGRAKSAMLVTNAVKMNIAMIAKSPFKSIRSKLRTALSSFEMTLESPHMFNAPYLVGTNGTINEGVHQSILLYNYAKVFAYRPFSFLWNKSTPQTPQCGAKSLEAGDLPAQSTQADNLAMVATRKTIEAANAIVNLLINTNSSQVICRTPVFACALALSSLVHISAYVWTEGLLKNPTPLQPPEMSQDDLDLYAEFIKLSLSALYPISTHWILSGRLAKHIRDSLKTLRPQLYGEMQEFLPQMAKPAIVMLDTKPVLPSPRGNDTLYPRPSHLIPSLDLSRSTTSQSGFQPTYIDSSVMGASDSIFSISSDAPHSPVSDTGCDWVDKALSDYFDGQNMKFMS